MAVIGIDLGTTNSLVSCWLDNKCVLIPNALGDTLTPSVVSIGENEEILVGKSAKERLVSHPDKTAAVFKTFMGTEKEYKLGDKTFLPEELSSFVLRRLKEDAEAYLGEEVTQAVVSVPAYFNDKQRWATKQAGQLTGLVVERIINEPSAAALAYQKDEDADGEYLVFDLGGGTLDISIVEMFANIVDVVAVSGDNRLGGGDIDNLILDAFLAENPALADISFNERATLLKLAEQNKIALTSSPTAMMVFIKNGESYSMQLNNQRLSEICTPLLARIRKTLLGALQGAGKSIQHITDVILVGGSCRMPLIKEYVCHLTGKTPLDGIDPDFTVAYGVGLVSGIKERREHIKDMVLSDICPFTLGTEIVSSTTGEIIFSPIISRNTPLPASRVSRYVTTSNWQCTVSVTIYQGESMDVKRNLKLGSLIISVPPLPKGEAEIDVRFTYDIDGVLEVDVHCPQNENRENMLIVSNCRMSEEELEQRRAKMDELKISPRDKEENIYLIAWGERLYEENVDPVRGQIAAALQDFIMTLEKYGQTARLEKLRAKIIPFFQQIEDMGEGLLGGEEL